MIIASLDAAAGRLVAANRQSHKMLHACMRNAVQFAKGGWTHELEASWVTETDGSKRYIKKCVFILQMYRP